MSIGCNFGITASSTLPSDTTAAKTRGSARSMPTLCCEEDIEPVSEGGEEEEER
jgi:hypothetical protein